MLYISPYLYVNRQVIFHFIFFLYPGGTATARQQSWGPQTVVQSPTDLGLIAHTALCHDHYCEMVASDAGNNISEPLEVAWRVAS